MIAYDFVIIGLLFLWLLDPCVSEMKVQASDTVGVKTHLLDQIWNPAIDLKSE